MIVTIDGPAGAGKSSAAKLLAERLGFRFLDTGAMYRAVALAAKQRGLDWDDHAELAQLIHQLKIDVSENQVLLDGENVTDAIRTMEITSVIHHVADHVQIRAWLVDLQRRIASQGDFVTEGRDQGTVAFPDAGCKIFLTASPEERAQRRMAVQHARGELVDFVEVLQRQNERDARDQARTVGRLVPAVDAIRVDTDGKPLDQVVDELEDIARTQLHLSPDD